METIKPPIYYVGNKRGLAPWIIPYFPSHKTYCEVFGGSGAVLFAKPESAMEIYNDVDDRVVNFFRVLRDRPQTLVKALDLTPYSRSEHRNSWECEGDPIEQARLFYLSMVGSFNSKFRGIFSTGTNSYKGHSKLFRNYRSRFQPVIDRLQTVVIECLSFNKLIPLYDTHDTLFYVDPPYVPETRGHNNLYKHEMTIDQHYHLLDMLLEVKGRVVLSGYPSNLYNDRLRKWRRVTKPHLVTCLKKRKAVSETLWINF